MGNNYIYDLKKANRFGFKKQNISIHKDELKKGGAEIVPLHAFMFTNHQLHRDALNIHYSKKGFAAGK